jgi:hypothetical protein
VKTVLKIDKGVGGPKSIAEVLTRDDLTRIVEQSFENSRSLGLQADFSPRFRNSSPWGSYSKAPNRYFWPDGERGNIEFC